MQRTSVAIAPLLSRLSRRAEHSMLGSSRGSVGVFSLWNAPLFLTNSARASTLFFVPRRVVSGPPHAFRYHRANLGVKLPPTGGSSLSPVMENTALAWRNMGAPIQATT